MYIKYINSIAYETEKMSVYVCMGYLFVSSNDYKISH